MNPDVDTFLEHHGIKGMKWGVRKRPPKGSTKGFSKDAKAAASIRKKAKTSPAKVKSLSNQEILDFTRRVQLESAFRNATPSNAKKTMNFVKHLLGVGNTVNQVATFANSPSGQAVRAGLNKKKAKSE